MEMDVTTTLRAIRQGAGVGVREMARRLGVAPSTYAHYEDPARFKARFLPMEEALRFADALGAEGALRDQVLALAGQGVEPRAVTEPATAPAGLAEEASPFQMAPSAGDPVRALYGRIARNPAVIYRAATHLPDFDIRPGDLLVCDQARSPAPGDVAIVSVADPQIGHAVTLVRRYLAPWLVAGTATDASPMRDDQEWTAILYPVIGIIRGAAS